MMSSGSLCLWAVHLSDGFLGPGLVTGGFILALFLVVLGSLRLREEEVPRIALLTAAFFVASLIRIPVWPTSVHLLLNGLLGVVLGVRAALAIAVGLFLQAVLLGHGGTTALGVNTCTLAIPALVSTLVFAILQRVSWVRHPWFRSGLVLGTTFFFLSTLVFCLFLLFHRPTGGLDLPTVNDGLQFTIKPSILVGTLGVSFLIAWAEGRLENAPEFPLGLLIGVGSVLLTVALCALALRLNGDPIWDMPTLIFVLAHLPVALIEGVILGFTVGFLAKVKPEMLGIQSSPFEPTIKPMKNEERGSRKEEVTIG